MVQPCSESFYMFEGQEQLAMFQDSQSSTGACGVIGARRSRESAEIPGLFLMISVPSRGAIKSIT